MGRGLKQLETIDGRASADTIRLWESYKSQSYFWRALTLIQLPTTFVALICALVMYFTADTVIEVPQKPMPGHYSVKQLPDSAFIDVGTEVVNLIASFQPKVARKQFGGARKYLWEPALSEFERLMLGEEIRAIEETGRSQLFFIDQKRIQIERYPNEQKIIVHLPGERRKLIGQKLLPTDYLEYVITMTTIPRHQFNEYGIVVVGISLNKLKGLKPA